MLLLNIIINVMKPILLILFIVCKLSLAQKDPHFEKGRNTIVHLFEWKWNDIALECENFLSVHGFAGVQISPPTENVIVNSPRRPWWERYQPISYKLVTRSGDENDLANMIRRCNAVGIRIYADVILNHMTGGSGRGIAGSTCDSSKRHYPAVPYTKENFHQPCDVNNYNDANNVRNCELSHLRDLNQTQNYVRQHHIDYLNHLIYLGVAGFRVDAAKHMWPNDLKYIFSSLNTLNPSHGFSEGSNAFIYQEIINTYKDAINNRDYIGFGRVLEFKYGNELGKCFQGRNPLKYLINWGTGWNLIEGENAVAFIDNHDTQRSGDINVLTYKIAKPYKAAIAFMLAHPYEATTRIMSSYTFSDFNAGPPSDRNDNIVSPGFKHDNTCTNGWQCEHRWRQIYNMVKFRNVVAGTALTKWWSGGDNQIAFSRGAKGFIALTINGDINSNIQTELPAGTYCDIISGNLSNGSCTGKAVTVDSSGNAAVSLKQSDFDAVLAIHIESKLS